MKEIFLFIILIFLIKNFLKLFKDTRKYYSAEGAVSKIISSLPLNQYKIINDVIIEINNKTIQIDHIVVSVYGIFVIETKDYNGWITGGNNSSYWTQNIFGNKYDFYNPIKQNTSHIIALSKILNLKYNNFISIIVFSNRATLRTKTNHNVINIKHLEQLICSYYDPLFSEEEISYIYEIIISYNINSNKVATQHISNVKHIIKDKNTLIRKNICPLCQHKLVIRKGKYGAFLACSNYPYCNFTLSLKHK